MKQLLITIAAVVLVGCGESQPPEPPNISIHEAAFKGDIEAVKQHLAAGTDVNAKRKEGWSVLDDALNSKNEELINFVKANGGKSNSDKSIYIASDVGDLEAVKKHLAAGTDVNAKDVDGYTPLHCAAQNGHMEIVGLLIDEGADVNAKDDVGDTPLLAAALFELKEVVELLISKGADVNAKNDEGQTPLDMAEGEIADLLRKHGGKTSAELKAEGK